MRGLLPSFAIVLLGGALTVSSASLSDGPPEPSAWQRHMDAAARAEREGRIADSEAALMAAEEEAGTRMLQVRSLEARADLYYRTGRDGEAEPLYRRCIELWEEILGRAQPRLGIPLHNLAVIYLKQCRVDEALPLARRVVELWGDTLGSAHPDRVSAISTEATLLRRCGRHEEATGLERSLPPSPAP